MMRSRAFGVSCGEPGSASARSSSSAWSAGSIARSTCTDARESSAELTSNDGFSVVAPTKVNRPDSTCGRKASCCDLLKRCTSSTKTIVRRPRVRASCACTTASRMSLTPASTADSTTNSASTAPAIRRASVVLPTPGGPHRIIECSRPEPNATRSGWPSPSRCCWPMTSSSVRGRRRSASGMESGGGSTSAGAGALRRGAGASSPKRLSCGVMAFIVSVPMGRGAHPPNWRGRGGLFGHSQCRPGFTLHSTDAARLHARVVRHPSRCKEQTRP